MQLPSVWKVVLSTLLSIVLVIGGVGITFYIISYLLAAPGRAAEQAKLDVANQLYQQVLGQPPKLQTSLLKSSGPWTTYNAKNWGCVMKSDGLHVFNNFHGDITTCITQQNVADSASIEKFTNFAFQVDMHILSGGGGIAWRENSIENMFYGFLIHQDGSYTIEIQNFLHSSVLASGQTAVLADKGHGTSSLTVIAKGNKMYLYINRTFVTMVQDATFSEGDVNVCASDEHGPSNVIYTNAKLWDLSV